MKIVYLNYLYDIKESSVGAAVHVKELTKALQACGHDVRTYFLNQFTSVEESFKSPVRGFLKKKLWRYLNQINALFANVRYLKNEWKIITHEKPDVILVRYNLLNFSLAIVALLKKVPFILEVNAPMAYESRKFAEYSFRIPLIPELIEKMYLRIANRVIVVSRELRAYYKSWHLPEQKLIFIPNGVDEHRFHPEIAAENTRTKLGLNNKIVVGFIGSFHYWHGLENLLHFIKLTLSRFHNVAFLLVGDGPLKRDLERIFKNHEFDKRVIFAGYVPHDEIPAHLAAMDIVLAPYPRLEFFYYSPLKIFEYLAAGKAVVASRIGQIQEIIQDGINGALFEPDNFEDLQEQLFALIEKNGYRQQLGRNGREMILQKYTWNHTAEKISEIMEEIIMKDDNR